MQTVGPRTSTALGRTSLLGALAIVAFALLWYWPTRRAGWVTDILGLAPRLNDGSGLAGAWTGYGAPVFHPLTLGTHYLLWHVGGPQSLLYYGVWILLHALTAWMIARSVIGLTAHFGLARGQQSGWLAALAFVVYPYVVEAVVWRATLNYLLVVPLILAACWAVFAFAKTGSGRPLAGSVVLAVLALFSFDLAWTLPAFALLAAVTTGSAPGWTVNARRCGVAFGAHAATLAVYLLAKTLVIGTAVGHYGAAQHLDASPSVILPNVWRTLTKMLLLTRELAFPSKHALNDFLGETRVYLGLTALAIGFLILWLLRLAPRSARWRLAGCLGIGAIVATLPTANLFYYYLLGSEGDRYSYFPSVCLLALLAVAWGGINWTGLRFGLGVLAVVMFGYFNRQHLTDWAEGAYAQQLLLDDFPIDSPGEVYVLAAADNYEGTYLFRDGNVPYMAMDYNLRHLRGWTRADSVENLVNFNQVGLDDSISANVSTAGEIELRFRQGGNWFWRGGIGLSSYERPAFEVTAGDPVRICFTEPLPTSTLLLYPTGRTWTALPHEGLRPCREIEGQ